MKILHYALGYPPLRTGGLTAYVYDLINEQLNEGQTNIVYLFPGKKTYISKKTKIKLDKKKCRTNFLSYELINSHPLALKGGIKNPKDFMKKTNKRIYADFFKIIMPDVIHIHSFMGLHKEFIDVANELNIKIIYTSHDYFGLSPVPNFYNESGEYSFAFDNSIDEWFKSSQSAYSSVELYLMQAKIYPIIRKFKKIVQPIRNHMILAKNKKEIVLDEQKKKSYSELKAYYKKMFLGIDHFHFNSSVAKEIFCKEIATINHSMYTLLSITNSNIKNNTLTEQNSGKRLGYIGAYENYKGFNYILDMFFNNLNDQSYELHLFGDNKNIPKSEKLYNHGAYKRSDLKNVYQTFDILIVPSCCQETFGFTVLEALSYGKKVIVSNYVGSKDILKKEAVFSFEKNNFLEVLKSVQVNNVCKIKLVTMDQHAKRIMAIYQNLVNK